MAPTSLRIALAAALLAGCYAPELRDCTVACSDSTDCAGDQVCGGDGYCAAPDLAGMCNGEPAPPKVSLRARVAGRGALEVAGVGTCTTDCTWPVAAGSTVQARAIEGDQEFDRWTTDNCAGQSQTCTLAMTASVIVGVKFH